MKLYISNIFDARNERGNIMLGIFSTPANALKAGKAYIEQCEDKAIYQDYDHDENSETYYFDGYTLTVIECELDEPN